ncbi:glycosyltransferase [Arsenicicoccus bolidensis]|uniref:glycosyltransferase n=1 Tax=Arsenicicoccus bolidensis TaxID=229480 RepID=UPI0028ADBB57|nr:glycosyltransferase [Arsenicicoccus bolidensis]
MSLIHLVVGPPEHGVTRCALELHGTVSLRDQPVVRVLDGVTADLAAALVEAGHGPGTPVHVHVTDRLLGRSAPEAAARLVPVAERWPLTVTLHDVPQPSDGPGAHERRAGAYADIVAASRGVVVSSHHESALLDDALRLAGRPGLVTARPRVVIPLPIDPPAEPLPPAAPTPAPTPGPSDAGPIAPGRREVGVLGFLYPGKGHEEALEALAAQPADVGLVCLGRPSPGHEDLVDALQTRAAELGRDCRITGFVPDEDLVEALRAVAVPVAPHRHLSASGSINTWLTAGRRPLVPRSRYVEELEARCPGALLVYDDLHVAVGQALEDPTLTWLGPEVVLGPDRDEAARSYSDTFADWATRPEISVVVPYYDDQRGLDLLLAALARQTLPTGSFEVVVADDGSPQPPVLTDQPYAVRLVRQPDAGFRASAARHLGATGSTGRILAFLDGDTLPTPDYLARLVGAVRSGEGPCGTLAVGRRRHTDLSGLSPADVVDRLGAGAVGRGASVQPGLPALPEPAWLREAYAASDDLRDADDRSYRFVISAVMALPRELYDAAGGFDPSFVGYGGEDWDLAHRCWLAGADLRHVPDAVAWHDGPDFAGRDDEDRRRTKDLETLRLARVLTDPLARDPRLVWHCPRVVVRLQVGDAGPAAVATCVASLLDGTDAGVWLVDADLDGDSNTPSGGDQTLITDPRVHRGEPSREVLQRCREQVDMLVPVELDGTLTELVDRGPVRTELVVVRRTRDLARHRARPRSQTGAGGDDGIPAMSSAAVGIRPVTDPPPLEAAWGGWA